MHKSATTSLNFFLLLLFSILLTSCFEPTPTQPEPPGEKPVEYEDIGPVAADGVLEAVTWNLEWYGHGFGPEDEVQQTKNFLTIIDSINADLYAFEEVADQKALNNIVSNMKAYSGFVAATMGGSQKTAFVYNTNTIDSVSSGLIKQGQDEYTWASGRFPFYFKFNYHANGATIPIYAVVIHAKCCTDQGDYERRKEAAQSLYDYLSRHKPDVNIILLGDYNDDMDESIDEGKPSPYLPFVTSDAMYRVITKSFSLNNQSTTVGYDDAVDHITISNELFDEYIPESEKVWVNVADLVNDYGSTTSDHYPVWAKFNL